ncbi:MAG: CPBP family intramembrane glutamic endopeptidase [Methylobacter sp.]|nr:CPBP family intramembrane metalloprotease [Methylobacter sp.]MDP2427386.1 CPBP family intramembrane metalloprotease [Methylobacter sp.]MDP3053713.1 CPBP family intramembrane metalloprotease [Methylobacter sp.]MDP3362917.1 CPBP family intramembrane metalloprotease [Methylobacter sp.]MDZ4218517.1 CPBP family intramembrane glutamic endopeptidase [Methylobacter sp.]
MDKSPITPDDFFKDACYFELSLILVAIAFGWLANINPFANLHFSEFSVIYGLVGTIPLFLLYRVLEQVRLESVIKIKDILFQTLGPALQRYHWTDLLILAAIAGLSEEILFRGLIQPWIEASWGMTVGLIATNIIFGLAHAVTPFYALLATLVGIYLSLSMDYEGSRNLLLPIIIHGFYDFLVFVTLMRTYRASR